MPKIDIWMPWYIADYQSDTAHLNPPQDSAYRRMLEHQWKTRKPLPNDIQALILITKMSPFFVDASSIPQACAKEALSIGRASASKDERMLYAWILDLLHQFFFQNPDGSWSQQRLEKELQLWGNRNQIAAERAAKAAWMRWHGPNSIDPKPWPGMPKIESKPGYAPSIPQGHPEQSPSPSPDKYKSKTRGLTSPAPNSSGKGLRRGGSSGRSPASKTAKKPPQPPGRKRGSGASVASPDVGTGAFDPSGAASTPPRPGKSVRKSGRDYDSSLRKPDPRFGPFREEIRKFWVQTNRELIAAGAIPKEFTFGKLDRIALSHWLQSHPDVTTLMFIQMLKNRAGTARVSFTQPPFKWIHDIMGHAEGKRDRYGALIP